MLEWFAKATAVIIVSGAIGLPVPATAAPEGDIVQTIAGKVQGAVFDDVDVFKGIPFAAPPVGDLRWRAPKPVQGWIGVRQATEYGPDCMQLPFATDLAPPRTQPSEDCLTINIWRPAQAREGAKLPVVVWIHGGGFVIGGSSPAVYEGDAFARRGVIFVSFNYRLGRFGLFVHPSLTAAKEGPLGNYAFMDQIEALRWVKLNIARFGGDAANVTIMGESAGGVSVLALMTTPAARGLFGRSIIMSGGGRSLGRCQHNRDRDSPMDTSADIAGINFAESVGVNGGGPDALARLRALPAATILGDLGLMSLLAPAAGPPTFVGIGCVPIVDGDMFVRSPEESFSQDQTANVPLIIGTTSRDFGLNTLQGKDDIFDSFGAYADEARAVYDPDGNEGAASIGEMVGADRAMHEPARFIAGQMARRGHPVYVYRFGYVVENNRSEWRGAPHASDIPFFFGTVAANYGNVLTAADRIAAEAANAYFVNFIRTGDPNEPGLPSWPAHRTDNERLLRFTLDDGPIAGPDPWRARLVITAKALAAQAVQSKR